MTKYSIVIIVLLFLFVIFLCMGRTLMDEDEDLGGWLVIFSLFCLFLSLFVPIWRLSDLMHVHDIYHINIEYSDHSEELYDGWDIDVKNDTITFTDEDGEHIINFSNGKVNYKKTDETYVDEQ